MVSWSFQVSEYIEHEEHGPSVGIVQKRFLHLDGLSLDTGQHLAPVTIAYELYGRLNSQKTNAVLICHALTGDSHVAGYYSWEDQKPGWWEFMVGPGKAIDTDRFCVICANVLGSCMGSSGPASINPKTRVPYGLQFPLITIGDMVSAQKALLDHLGVQKVLSVIGGSVGGMQVLEWSIRFPEKVATAIPIATTPRHSALAIAFNEVGRQAIMADPNWNQGDYYAGKPPDLGLAVARMIGHITYLSDESMRLKFGRRLQNKSDFSYNFEADFQVESYLHHQGKKFVERFDANSFLYITKAADYYDLGREHGSGSIVDAFAKSRARYLLISFTSDWLYPTYQSREMIKAMKKSGLEVSFCEIEAGWGHDAFLLPNDKLTSMIAGFLNNAFSEIDSP
jgi:homoserine O-acetyltransferase